MPNQRCPNCGFLHDVGIYTSGTRVRCYSCKIPFVVQRPDSQIADAQLLPSEVEKNAGAATAVPSPGSKTQAGAAEEPRIRGYSLYEILGKGGMGRVYRALQVSLSRVVAIKVLSEDLARHQSFIRRFEKEAGALASLNHPNIISIFDRGNSGGIYYFVMEYVDGPSLRQLINRGGMALDDVFRKTLLLCSAMAHAHKRQVIHRDLKPENVLFGQEGALKVADFGLANIVAPDRRWELTRTQVSMGTVNYMAPEQRKDAKHVDARADIFSLGVMLYEMLCGDLPLGRFEPPSKKHRNLNQRVDDLVLRMLDPNPDRRPQSAELCAAQLEALLGPRSARTAPAAASPARMEREVAAAPEHIRPASPAPAEPPPAEENLSTLVSAQPVAQLRQKGAWRMSSLLALLVGGMVLLLLSALGVTALLTMSNLGDSPGDLSLRQGQQGLHLEVVHPRRLEYLSPASVREGPGPRALRFDFLPSALPVVPVTFIGGNWEIEHGRLVQDTCRSGLTLNRAPARALFGETEISPQGLELIVSVQATAAVCRRPGSPHQEDAPQKTPPGEIIGRLSSLLPVPARVFAGLGFMDRQSRGLELLLPLDLRGAGRLRLWGAEEKDRDFDLPEPERQKRPTALKLSIAPGRVRLCADDLVLLDEPTGLPPGYRGFPTVCCQNARCEFSSVEYRIE